MSEQNLPDDRPAYISRRGFVSLAGLTGVGIAAPTWAVAEQRAGSGSAKPTEPPHEEEDVAPPEDLMREHGVLKRVLLIYEEGIRRIERSNRVARLDQEQRADHPSFIEEYHEKLEEDHLFPRFEKAGSSRT